MGKRVALHNLGCKVNAYELDEIAGILIARGYEPVPFSDDADIYIVNTCTVTNIADRKSRQMLHRAKKKNPHALVVALGCYVDTDPAGVEKDACIDIALGNRDKAGLAEVLATYEQQTEEETGAASAVGSCETVAGDTAKTRYRTHTRAFLKVQDGCNLFCSYCIIPYARGPVRSEPLPDAVRQARELAADGVREIVLTGIEISSWGRDLPGSPTLIDLTEALCAAVPGVRIRLGSLEPRTVTADFCRRARALPNLCPQFHLSLQSGCDDTLKRMRRRYDTTRYRESVQLLRAAFDNPAITTDLITGFPGETETEFARTLDFLRECGFARMHIFPYSPRPGTPAADMPQIAKAVKDERAGRAKAVADTMRAEYLSGCVGREYDVLFEQSRGGVFHGHAPNYAEVYAPGEGLHNECRRTRIVSSDGAALYGEIL